MKGSGRKDDAFVVDDDDSVSEAEEEEDGGEREYVVVSGGESDAEDDAPIGVAALEQNAAKRKVLLPSMTSPHPIATPRADLATSLVTVITRAVAFVVGHF